MFINEYRQLLAERLLQLTDYDTTGEVCGPKKHQFDSPHPASHKCVVSVHMCFIGHVVLGLDVSCLCMSLITGEVHTILLVLVRHGTAL